MTLVPSATGHRRLPCRPASTIDEVTLALEAVGTDPTPRRRLHLPASSAPAGVTLNPNSGAISWVTGEGTGPSTNPCNSARAINGSPASVPQRVSPWWSRVANQPPTLIGGSANHQQRHLTIPCRAGRICRPIAPLSALFRSACRVGHQPDHLRVHLGARQRHSAGTNHITVLF